MLGVSSFLEFTTGHVKSTTTRLGEAGDFYSLGSPKAYMWSISVLYLLNASLRRILRVGVRQLFSTENGSRVETNRLTRSKLRNSNMSCQ